MKKQTVYMKDWVDIHPYTAVQPSDSYFVALANRLYEVCLLNEMPVFFRKKLCLYVAAYLEDVISGLGLWRAFVTGHSRLYGKPLPFYSVGSDYLTDEINREDVAFIVWNTWVKALYEHTYVDPSGELIGKQTDEFWKILQEAYEEAPENDVMNGVFAGFGDMREADRKLNWLFGHSYLTEPSMLPYIGRVEPKDRFIIPVGPPAFFLSEWIDLLAEGNTDCWRQVKGLYQPEPVIPAAMRQRNAEMYRNFTAATGGKPIVFLDGYDSLRRFLVEVLKWQDDEAHTLPQMKNHRNFVLMSNPEKGILLAKDICEYIAAAENPMYDARKASLHAFSLLTEETVCPPDLLVYCIQNNLLPDAALPGGNKEAVAGNADFIARHALLYYYRGD